MTVINNVAFPLGSRSAWISLPGKSAFAFSQSQVNPAINAGEFRALTGIT
jgi:hypothetical protein